MKLFKEVFELPVLSLKDSELARNAITKRQQKQIRKLYRDVAKDIAEEAKSLKSKTNVSSIMRTQYLQTLEKQITVEVNKISTELHKITQNGMKEVAEVTTKESLQWLSKLGFQTKGLLSNVPANVVRNIATGQVYTTGWSLSQRIWGIEQKTLQDIHTVIAKGVAKNASVYDIAKDLEKYVNPSAAKKWDWNKVYPGTSRKIDYNAQRLARTLTQHAFQQATKECNDPNPFVDGYIWHSAFAHGRTCSTCMDRDGTLYKKEEVPMDHPQGLCTILPYVEKDLSYIANQIADWTEAPEGTYPEIDQFWDYLKRN